MGILGRFIFKEILKTLLPVWFALGFLLFLLEWLAQVFTIKASAMTVFMLYAYKAPSHLQIVFPIAVIVSVLIVLGGMNRNREVVAAQSVGFKPLQLIAPVALAVAFGACIDYVVLDKVAPWGMRRHYETMDEKVENKASRFLQVRQEKIWYRNRDILYNVGYFAADRNELFDVTIYTFDESFHIAQTIFSQSADWDGKSWILHDGTINLTDRRLQTPVSEKFDSRKTRLIEAPSSLKRVEFYAETMGQSELHHAIKRQRFLGINTNRWEVVYHSRFSMIFVSLAFLLLAFPMSLKFSRQGGSRAKDFVVVLALAMTYWTVFSYCINMGNNGKMGSALSAWLPAIVLFFVVLVYVNSQRLSAQRD